MPSRRRFLHLAGAAAGSLAFGGRSQAAEPGRYQLATFEADITPPVGHPLLGGMRGPAVKVVDPLSARGLVLIGADEPLVIAALDWCELRNDAYDQFRQALADAVKTTRQRVLISCLHQHDAPYFDLTAHKLLQEAGLGDAMFQPAFFQATVKTTAAAAQAALAKLRPVTHVGTGEAHVERVACNRRVVGADGKPRFNRFSSARDPAIRDAPDGEIDPLLKTLSFWDASRSPDAGESVPLAAVSAYATHPMSYYGNGEVSHDFPGIARDLRQREAKDVFQMYITGASGDVVAARYNDGTPAGRQALAGQLLAGMQTAWQATKRKPLEKIGFRCEQLAIPPPVTGSLAPETLEKTLRDSAASQAVRVQAALGLSYQRRAAAGQSIDVPAIDFGPAQYLVLPAEMFVGYQLAAQRMRPDQMVLVAGFGECAPGYIPTDQARREGFVEEHGYTWVEDGVEQPILKAIRAALAAR